MAWGAIFKSIVGKILSETVGKELIDAIKKLPKIVRAKWKGKKIAAIGPTAAGKNSFYNRLRRQEIPDQHHQTRSAENVEKFPFRQTRPDSGVLNFECKRSINVGGETDERERYWLQACDDADVVFYIIDVERLQREGCTAGSRIHADLKWIATNISRMRENTLVHILVNKVDLLLVSHKTAAAVGEHLVPDIDALQAACKSLFGAYAKRVTGVTPISMRDEHIFNTSFAEALVAVEPSLV
jgi:hypothetical protein